MTARDETATKALDVAATRFCASNPRYAPPDEHDTLLELSDRFLAAWCADRQRAALRAVDHRQACHGLAVARSWPNRDGVRGNSHPKSTHRIIQARCGRMANQRQACGSHTRRSKAACLQPVSTPHLQLSRMSRASRIRKEWRLQHSCQRERELQHSISHRCAVGCIEVPIRSAAAFPGMQRWQRVHTRMPAANSRKSRRMHTYVGVYA